MVLLKGVEIGLIDENILEVDYHITSWNTIFAFVSLEVGVEFLITIIYFAMNVL